MSVIPALCSVSGYSFLLFQDEVSVQNLIEACMVDEDKLYWCVSSPTMKNKPVSWHFLSLCGRVKYLLACFEIDFLLRKVERIRPMHSSAKLQSPPISIVFLCL